MSKRSENRPRYTSGLLPHLFVSGMSTRMDEEKDYRLCSATYHLIVALSDFPSRLRLRLKAVTRKAEIEALYER